MKLHLDLPALYQNIQGVSDIKSSEIKSRLIKIFEKLKSTAPFYKVPFVAIVARIAFILSIILIGQLFFSLINPSLWAL